MRQALTLPRAVVAIFGLVLVIVVLRHYWPPNRNAAFPLGEIIVGVDASYPPFAIDDGVSLAGLDVDLAKAIAADLDLPVRFVNIGFYGLYDALISGEVDLLISALRIDPSRMDDVRYSQYYFDNGLVLVTPLDTSLPDSNALTGKGIAYEYASSADSQIRGWEAQGVELMRLPYELPQYALDALRLNLADAALVDTTTVQAYQTRYSNWSSAHRYVTHDLFAIAVRHDRIDTLKLVDGALSTLKDSGELARIIDKWL